MSPNRNVCPAVLGNMGNMGTTGHKSSCQRDSASTVCVGGTPNDGRTDEAMSRFRLEEDCDLDIAAELAESEP